MPLNERSVCFALSLASHYVLASLVKGRWLDGKAQALTLLHLLAICPLFYIAYFSAVKTKGLSRHHLSPRTNPFQNRTTPLTFLNANIYMHLYAFTFALSHALFVGRGARPSRCTEPIYPHDHCKRTITPCSHHPSSKPHYPSKSTTTLASPRKRGGGTADTIFWLAVQYSDSPAFTILKLFRAVTVGIAPHLYHH